ncbi:MAG: hypothetical protein IJK77_06570 [Lachnospiraceae bacterium]|nr:hypothetical protein [Lachnospiraceae bacterium]
MLMFINPMLILSAEAVLEKSFENRNPTLFAIGAGMLGVGTVGWAGTKAFVKKESKAKKPMNRTFKTTGGASILVILASLLAGLGFGGGGTGVGEGDASTVAPPAESTQESLVESTAETYAEDIVLRVNKTEIYVNDTLCKDDAAVQALLVSEFKDGNTVLLIDDYADNETYEKVKDVLKELAITYTEKRQ